MTANSTAILALVPLPRRSVGFPCPICGQPIRWGELLTYGFGRIPSEPESVSPVPLYWECLLCGWNAEIPIQHHSDITEQFYKFTIADEDANLLNFP